MNKQYVKEQIDIAINGLRKEYDAVIKNIYQCPDCGAVAFRNGEHICFKAAPIVTPEVQKPITLMSKVFDAIPVGEPSPDITIFKSNSPYTPSQIVSSVVKKNELALPASVLSTISLLFRRGKVCRKVAAIGDKTTSIVPGYVYWRSS